MLTKTNDKAAFLKCNNTQDREEEADSGENAPPVPAVAFLDEPAAGLDPARLHFT
jgi:hypothetical protein